MLLIIIVLDLAKRHTNARLGTYRSSTRRRHLTNCLCRCRRDSRSSGLACTVFVGYMRMGFYFGIIVVVSSLALIISTRVLVVGLGSSLSGFVDRLVSRMSCLFSPPVRVFIFIAHSPTNQCSSIRSAVRQLWLSRFHYNGGRRYNITQHATGVCVFMCMCFFRI